MKRYVATKKFDELGTECSYHGLSFEQYHALKAGKAITDPPKELVDEGYLKEKKNGS